MSVTEGAGDVTQVRGRGFLPCRKIKEAGSSTHGALMQVVMILNADEQQFLLCILLCCISSLEHVSQIHISESS